MTMETTTSRARRLFAPIVKWSGRALVAGLASVIALLVLVVRFENTALLIALAIVGVGTLLTLIVLYVSVVLPAVLDAPRQLRKCWNEVREHPWRLIAGAILGAAVGVMPFTGRDAGAVLFFAIMGMVVAWAVLSSCDAQVEQIWWRILNWHAGQLVLVWLAALVVESLLMKLFNGGYAAPLALLIDRASEFWSATPIGLEFDPIVVFRPPSFADELLTALRPPLAVLYVCVPVVMFRISWAWLEARR